VVEDAADVAALGNEGDHHHYASAGEADPADPGELTDRCGVLVYHTREGRLSESSPAGWIDVGEYSNEIYDLLALSGVS